MLELIVDMVRVGEKIPEQVVSLVFPRKRREMH